VASDSPATAEWPADLPSESNQHFDRDGDRQWSLGTVVKAPFDATRQIQCLIKPVYGVPGSSQVAGEKPGPRVNAMVNIADLYQLFVSSPESTCTRAYRAPWMRRAFFRIWLNPRSGHPQNFYPNGTNLHANGEINSPCQSTLHLLADRYRPKGVCEDNSGIWWVPRARPIRARRHTGGRFGSCALLAIWQANQPRQFWTNIYPLEGVAIRNASYKVVAQLRGYDATSNSCVATSDQRFFPINEKCSYPELDTTDSNLLHRHPLNREQKKN